jgi:2-polyprenyl-3-methyl-5-hydroxy-6-metoxy-1,4-benzoquinol methylase
MESPPSRAYQGRELELFAVAGNWKNYWREHVAQLVSGSVLEVGAGIGSNTRLLHETGHTRWVCLEPDVTLAARIPAGAYTPEPKVIAGTIQGISEAADFDTILYLDVLEHIADDRDEVDQAVRRLRAGGRLIILAPAHQWLFSPFDRELGHHRRYTRQTLQALMPPGMLREKLVYLDTVGVAASLANRLLLRRPYPAPAQLAVWDRLFVPVSRVCDPLLGFRVGRSVLGIWRRHV